MDLSALLNPTKSRSPRGWNDRNCTVMHPERPLAKEKKGGVTRVAPGYSAPY
jgi:hypothetical protein